MGKQKTSDFKQQTLRQIMKTSILILLFHLIALLGYSQGEFRQKYETGYLHYQYNIVQVDPGPTWRGYYLSNHNGFDLNIINGLTFKDKIFTGIGLGYLNFEGINGFSIFTDYEIKPFKSKLSPYINLKIGYNHIWNQYEHGTDSALGDLSLGLNYKMKSIDSPILPLTWAFSI